MAIAGWDRTKTVTKSRIILGVTDATKGGPADSVFEGQIDAALRRYALLAKALQTNIKLATKANDKYLPLVDEILWPITVSFVDSEGTSYGLDLVEVAPRPGTIEDRPRVWWLTSVNVPDVTGPAVRTIGIDPAVNWAPAPGEFNVLLEAMQLPQDFSGASGTAEIHVALQPYISYFLAHEMLGLFPEKMDRLPLILQMEQEAVEQFKLMTSAQFKTPKSRKNVRNYGAGAGRL